MASETEDKVPDSGATMEKDTKKPGDGGTSKKSESSAYYYWHGHEKSRAQAGDIAPKTEPLLLKSEVVHVEKAVKTKPITKYSWCNNDKTVSVYIDHSGVGSLPPDSISVQFEKSKFVVSIAADETRHHLAIQLAKEIKPETSSYRMKPDQLKLTLAKAEVTQTWFDLEYVKGWALTGTDD